MINIESKEDKNDTPDDTTEVDIIGHIVIKDVDADQIIVSQRG